MTTQQDSKRIKYKLWHPSGQCEFDGGLPEGLFYAAHHMTGQERLDFIAKLQEKHAQLEAMGR